MTWIGVQNIVATRSKRSIALHPSLEVDPGDHDILLGVVFDGQLHNAPPQILRPVPLSKTLGKRKQSQKEKCES